MRFLFKRGVSSVMATILIILLALIIIAAVSAIVLPFVRNNLSGAQTCLEAQYGVRFVETRLTCFDEDASLAGFTILVNKKGIKKFRVSLADVNGATNTFDVEDGDNPAGFAMFGTGQPGVLGTSQIQIPYAGQQLTYIASGMNIVRAEVAPIVKNSICSIDDSVEFNSCPGDVNLAQGPLIDVNVNVN